MQVIGSAVLETHGGEGRIYVVPPVEWGLKANESYRIAVNRPDDVDELAVTYHTKARGLKNRVENNKVYFTLRAEDGYVFHEMVRLTVSIDDPSGYEYVNVAARSKHQD